MTGKDLKNIRIVFLNMTQKELAKKLNVSVRTLSRWESVSSNSLKLPHTTIYTYLCILGKRTRQLLSKNQKNSDTYKSSVSSNLEQNSTSETDLNWCLEKTKQLNQSLKPTSKVAKLIEKIYKSIKTEMETGNLSQTCVLCGSKKVFGFPFCPDCHAALDRFVRLLGYLVLDPETRKKIKAFLNSCSF